MNLRKKTRKNKYRKRYKTRKQASKKNKIRVKINNKKKSRGKSRKIMKGGIATFNSYPDYPGQASTNSNIHSVPIGNNQYAQSTYVKGDTPFFPKNVIPQPVNQLKWSVQSGLSNFFNELFGQPKTLSPNPTDQPIGKTMTSGLIKPLTTNTLNNIRSNIIDKYSNT